MAPHSSTLAWKISWMEEPGRLKAIIITYFCIVLFNLFIFIEFILNSKNTYCIIAIVLIVNLKIILRSWYIKENSVAIVRHKIKNILPKTLLHKIHI